MGRKQLGGIMVACHTYDPEAVGPTPGQVRSLSSGYY